MTTTTTRGTTTSNPAEVPGRTKRPSAPWTLVARREIISKLTDRAFLLSTVMTIVIMSALLVIQGLLGSRGSTYDVAILKSDSSFGQELVTKAPKLDDKVSIRLTEVADPAAAEKLVRDQDADAWLHTTDGQWILTGRTEVPTTLQSVTTQVVSAHALEVNAEAAGTTPEAMTRGGTLKTALLVGDVERSTLATGLGFVMAILFYMASLLFGITLAQSVVEEKQSRIVEIIAAAIPIRQLLAGKVVGNSILAMAQVALYVAVGLVGLSFTQYGSLLPSVTGPILWFVAFFVVGFIALSCLWAVAGSLASRTEDIQSTTMPLTMLMVAVFFGGLFLKGSAATIGSFVPPISPILMPKRMLEGGLPIWQPILALALLAAFAVLTIRLGERIYRRSLLQTQGQMSLRKAWSAAD